MKTTAAHWGLFTATDTPGADVELAPYGMDPDPSEFWQSMLPGRLAPSRLLRPLVRKAYLDAGPAAAPPRTGCDRFVPMPWDEALDLAASELEHVRAAYGNQAIYAGSYGWASAGRFHHAQSQIHRFLNAIGGYTASINTYSHAAAEVLLPYVVGAEDDIIYSQTTWPVIAEHTELIVSFGGLPVKNTQINAGGLAQHVARRWLEQCVAAGCSFINIGPLRDASPDFLKSTWIPVTPNSDTALMLGIAHTLEVEGLVDRAFLERYTVGYERFRDYLTGRADGVAKSGAWASAICGVSADTIETLARQMVSRRTMVTSTWALQRADHGEQPFWMTVVLAAMLGQIGLPGGGFGFGLTSMHGPANPIVRRGFASLPQGRNPVEPRIPVARVADMLLNPGGEIDFDGKRITYPDIQLVYWAGGNPFHHQQDLGKLQRAWRKPRTVICHELHWNSLARHSDIVFPVASTLERNDIMAASSDSAVAPMHKLFDPPGEARTDYDILSGLAARMGVLERFTEGRDEMAWLRVLYDLGSERRKGNGSELPDFETFWAGGVFDPEPDRDVQRIQFESFRRDPEANPLVTPTGKIEIYSQTIADFGYDDCPGHPVWMAPYEWVRSPAGRTYPLHLISDQPRFRLHSQLDNVGASASSKIQGREPMRIHPDDARARGIEEGAIVRVFNDRGALLAGAVISSAVAPGSIQISTGAWFDPHPGMNDRPFCRGGNANVLTADRPTSKLAQAPTALTALVEVELFRGEVPRMADPRPPAR